MTYEYTEFAEIIQRDELLRVSVIFLSRVGNIIGKQPAFDHFGFCELKFQLNFFMYVASSSNSKMNETHNIILL